MPPTGDNPQNCWEFHSLMNFHEKLFAVGAAGASFRVSTPEAPVAHIVMVERTDDKEFGEAADQTRNAAAALLRDEPGGKRGACEA